MKVVVIQDGRFVYHEGKPSNNHLTYEKFWTRYLDVFDSVVIVGRIFPVEDPTSSAVEGPNVTFLPITGYSSPAEFLLNGKKLARHILHSIPPDAAVIVRAPCIAGILLVEEMQRMGRPYALEVVADPYDGFAPGSFDHTLRPFFRYWFPRQLRRQCAHADSAAYVTAEALQRRYPCPNHMAGVSDVHIPSDALLNAPRTFSADRPYTLICVGGMEQMYKAHDVQIDAVGQCVKEGLDLHLHFVGDGKHRPELAARAAALGLGQRVQFWGQLPGGHAVRTRLDASDIFLLPSRQEGLPRAMVEAMARAMPCIGSTVGGIPELLSAEDMVPPVDASALAHKIREVVSDPARMARMSARNLETAHAYREEILCERRREFYRHVRERMESWAYRQRIAA